MSGVFEQIGLFGWIGIALLLTVAAVLALAMTRPDHFRTVRTLHIAAKPERIFPLIADLGQMNTWNPFARRETLGQATYSGPASGKGAKFEFAGSKSGTGHIEVVDTEPPRKVTMRLVMTKPFKADNVVQFTLQPADTGTDVTWAMSGRQPLMAKVMSMVIDCDRMVGREFEQGLALLKSKAEAA